VSSAIHSATRLLHSNIDTFHASPRQAQARTCCCCTILSLSASCDAAQSVTSNLPFKVSSALRHNVALNVNLQEAHKSLILVKGQTKNCGKELVDNIKYDEEVFILCPMLKERTHMVLVKTNSNALDYCFCTYYCHASNALFCVKLSSISQHKVAGICSNSGSD